MNAFLNYQVEVNLSILAMLGAYWFLLRKETNFKLKRAFLIGGVVLSLTFPLLQVGDRNEVIPTIGNVLPSYFLLPELVIGEDSTEVVTATQAVNYWRIVTWIYLAGVGILLLHLLFHLGRLLIMFRRHSTWKQYGKYKVLELDDPLPIFSFFHYIVLGNAKSLSPEDKEQVIRHEAAHARHLHSADVLLLHAAKILLWFNPFIYLYQKMLSDVHEFQADEKAAQHHDVQKYCSLLARITLQSAGFSFTNHFNKSLTVKRIEMIKTIKTKIDKWKIAAIAVVAAGLFFVVACQDQVMYGVNTVAQSTTMELDLPPIVQAHFDKLKSAYPESNFVVVEVMKEDGPEKLRVLAQEHGELNKLAKMDLMTLGPDFNHRSFVIMKFHQASPSVDKVSSSLEIHLVVEETATPKGGIEEYYHSLRENLKYPHNARNAGIEGQVFVEFVVEKDGTLTNFHVLKGIGYGCDEAAVSALENSPAWQPGRQRGKPVRQKMVLPVTFKAVGEPAIQTGTIEESLLSLKVDVRKILEENGKTHVAGFVKDANGNPLPGANLLEMHTTNGTATDINGKFIMSLSTGGTLGVSFVGYETKTVTF